MFQVSWIRILVILTSITVVHATMDLEVNQRALVRKAINGLAPDFNNQEAIVLVEDSYIELCTTVKDCHDFWRLMASFMLSGVEQCKIWHDALMLEGFNWRVRRDSTLIAKAGWTWGSQAMSPTEKAIVSARFHMEDKKGASVAFAPGNVWGAWKESDKANVVYANYMNAVLGVKVEQVVDSEPASVIQSSSDTEAEKPGEVAALTVQADATPAQPPVETSPVVAEPGTTQPVAPVGGASASTEEAPTVIVDATAAQQQAAAAEQERLAQEEKEEEERKAKVAAEQAKEDAKDTGIAEQDASSNTTPLRPTKPDDENPAEVGVTPEHKEKVTGIVKEINTSPDKDVRWRLVSAHRAEIRAEITRLEGAPRNHRWKVDLANCKYSLDVLTKDVHKILDPAGLQEREDFAVRIRALEKPDQSATTTAPSTPTSAGNQNKAGTKPPPKKAERGCSVC